MSEPDTGAAVHASGRFASAVSGIPIESALNASAVRRITVAAGKPVGLPGISTVTVSPGVKGIPVRRTGR